MNRNDFWLVTYAALIHDIGKFYLRAVDERKQHPLFVKDYLQETGFYFKEIGIDLNELEIVATHHHESPYFDKDALVGSIEDDRLRILAKIVSTADNFSSSERYKEEKRTDKQEAYRKAFLENIFSFVKIDSKGSEKEGVFFPVRLDKEVDSFLKEKIDPNKNWKPYFLDFLSTVKKIEISGAKKASSMEDDLRRSYLTTLLSIFRLYLWAVPSDVAGRRDVSLYDHLKTTTAIASALFKWLLENEGDKFDDFASLEKKISDGKEKRFLLIGGDVGGIQRFITGFKNVGGAVARRLRGRSFYVLALSKGIASYIVKELGLTNASIIYNCGGKFYILAPNTNTTLNTLEKLKREINEHLIESYGGNLPVYLSWVAVSGNELGLVESTKDNIFRKIENKLSEEKNRPFRDILTNDNGSWLPDKFILRGKWLKGEYCQVCELKPGELNEEGIRICETCLDEAELGRALMKFNYFAIVDSELPSVKSFNLFGKVKIAFINNLHQPGSYLILNNLRDEAFSELLDSKDGKIPIGFEFNFSPYYAPKDDTTGDLKTFEDIAKSSEGDCKLGVVKADVDKLGLIVQKGIDNLSISRLSTFSLMLDYFFSWKIKQKIQENHLFQDIYIIYAGGDDLFYLGPWDKSLKFIDEVFKEFKKWTAENNLMSISVGMSIVDDHIPVYTISEAVAEELKNAKQFGNSFSIMDVVSKSDDLNLIIHYSDKLARAIQINQISRTTAQKLTDIFIEWKETERRSSLPLYAPHLAYLITRDFLKDKDEKLIGSGKVELQNFLEEVLLPATRPSRAQELMPKIGLIAQTAKMLTRNIKAEESD